MKFQLNDDTDAHKVEWVSKRFEKPNTISEVFAQDEMIALE